MTIPNLVKDTGAGLLVTDYGPLRLGRQWREKVCGRLLGRSVPSGLLHALVSLVIG